MERVTVNYEMRSILWITDRMTIYNTIEKTRKKRKSSFSDLDFAISGYHSKYFFLKNKNQIIF